jgi:Fibronectin type III domain
MKKNSASQSVPPRRGFREGGFFNLRVSIGVFVVVAGVFLALAGSGALSATAQTIMQAMQKGKIITSSTDPLVPVGFDCSTIYEKGIDKQENFRAGAIMIACGQTPGGSTSATSTLGPVGRFMQTLFAPLANGAVDVNLITGPDTSPNVTQSETYTLANPDNPNQIVVAYNDSRGRNASPINISGASVSTDGGTTFTRLTKASGQGPFEGTEGDPVVLYNKPSSTWFTVWLDVGCGAQGLGGYKSTTPWDPNSWTHFCIHSNSQDDRESGWADNNPSSPFYGRMYVSWNDFNVGGGALFVTYSSDNGNTWHSPIQVNGSFVRDVQMTGDKLTGDLYIAAMNENGGNGNFNRNNLIYRSTDGGNNWVNTYSGPTFVGPHRTNSGYFACMYNNPAYWRHMGWGEPAAYNHVVSYVYAAANAGNGDPGDVFYIRSSDSGQTFSAPVQLNTDTDHTKAQWQPNVSVSDAGTLLATWYDETPRIAASCQPSSPSTPCYRMFSRKSNDNGVTWLPPDTLSDVVSPLPLQGDPGIQALYAGDYDYGSAILSKHVTSWVDGRNAISGSSQQDAYTDKEASGPSPTASPTPTATATASPTPTNTPTPTPCVGQYTITQIAGTIVPGTTDIGNHGDDTVTTIALPFSYTLYDQTFSSINLSSNGSAQFTTTDTSFSNQCLPWTAHNYTIFAYWDDLYLLNSGFGIFTSISGTAPNRIFNIEWRAQYYHGSGTANFELRLYEGQSRFDIMYGTATNGSTSSTAGVQRDDSTVAQYFCNGSGGAAIGAQAYTVLPCGTPFPTPTATATATATVAATATATATATFAPTATATATFTPTATATATFTPTATATATFTPTATATATSTPTATATSTPTATVAPSPTPPAAPRAAAASNVTATSFTANWRSVSGATGYRLDVSTSSTFVTYVTVYNNLDVGNTTSRNVTGLASNTNYYYRLRAYNGNGTSPNSNVIKVKTKSR